MSKISIRFFNDREVRAVWDDENSKWWFNVIDIIAILNEQDDYAKANNYWRWLKRKLKNEGNEVVSATHGFKFIAPDGKKRLSDTLDSNGIIELAKNFPNNRNLSKLFYQKTSARNSRRLFYIGLLTVDCCLLTSTACCQKQI